LEAFVDWGYWVFGVAGLVVVMGLVLCSSSADEEKENAMDFVFIGLIVGFFALSAD
jgi:hypothetical protein